MRFPPEIKLILDKLKDSKFSAFVVGGCVRDLFMGKKPTDWDIATNARPKQIQKIFPDSFYKNKFGTVTVKTKSLDQTLKEVEITPFRIEAKYSDKRHPDEIKFTDRLEDDLARRDFTINAMALAQPPIINYQLPAKIKKINNFILVDLFGGQKDIKDKLVRAVGKADERFNEDALRLLRAIRFAYILNFDIEKNTFEAIKKNSLWIKAIAKERIKDELLKIIQHTPQEWRAKSKKLEVGKEKRRRFDEITEEEFKNGPARAFELLRQTGLLKYILPELEEGYGVTQNKHHIYTVWEHNLRSFAYSVKENFNWHVRLASLFHDIAKPRTKKGEGPDSTFYSHDVLGARMVVQILSRLKFPKKDIEKIALLVRYHLFQSDPEKITDSAVRRIVRNVGPENIWDLINVRISDRIGSGVPKARPYRLRKFLVMLEKALREPISLKQLKINGNRIMEILGITPGPRVGYILNALMSEILDEPEKNEKEYLEKKTKELNKLTDEELKKLFIEAKQKMAEIEYKKDEETKKKYWVS